MVTADEARLLDEIRRPDRLGTEAQVRHGPRPGLLRVVDEVALGVQRRFGAEDLDRVLVGPDRPVGPEAEEDRPQRLGRLDVERRLVGEAQPRDVVGDADGESPSGSLPSELFEHRRHHGRRELLRGQSVAAADDQRHDVRVRRCRVPRPAAQTTSSKSGSPSEPGSLVRSRTARRVTVGGSAGQELLGREGPVEAYRHHPHPLAARAEVGDGLPGRLGPRAHHDHGTRPLRGAPQ